MNIGKPQSERCSAFDWSVYPDLTMDCCRQIADKRETEAMPGADVGVVIEERVPPAGGNTRTIVSDGEADMPIFSPGPPFDQSVRPVVDGFDGVGS